MGHKAEKFLTKEYRTWEHMKRRCHCPTDKSYPRYGGKGVRVCDAWRSSFDTFISDVGRAPTPSHTIDRIDNGAGYEPGNVRWATAYEQQNNRSDNRKLTFGGETRGITEWSRVVGIARRTIEHRLAAGWPIERALTEAPSLASRRSE